MNTAPAHRYDSGRVLPIVSLGLVLLLLAACDVPRDVEGTLERVRGGSLRVGVTHNEPWVVTSGEEPVGVEVRLVEELAGDLGADVTWVVGSETELLEALEVRELDLVAGGLATDSPWSGKVTLTAPYVTTRLVIGVPPATGVDPRVEGMRVLVEVGSAAGALVEAEGAVAVRVTEISDPGRAAAVPEWQLDELGLVDSGIELEVTEHVMAVPHGENDWLAEV